MFTKATSHLRPFIRLPSSHSPASPDHFTANPSLLHHLPQHGASNSVIVQGQHSAQAGSTSGHAGRTGYGGGAGAGGGYTGHARAFLSLPQTASVDPSSTLSDERKKDASGSSTSNTSLLLKHRLSKTPRIVHLNDSVRARRAIEERKGGKDFTVVELEEVPRIHRRESIAEYTSGRLPLTSNSTRSLARSHTSFDIFQVGIPQPRSIGLRALSTTSDAPRALEAEDIEAIEELELMTPRAQRDVRTVGQPNRVLMDLAGRDLPSTVTASWQLGGVRRNSTAAVERPSLDLPPADLSNIATPERKEDKQREEAIFQALQQAKQNGNVELVKNLITHYRSPRSLPPFSPDSLPGVPELSKHYPLPSGFSIRIYNACLIAALATRSPGQSIAPILEIYNELLEKDIIPDSMTYGAVIRALAMRERDVRGSQEIWERQKTWGLWRAEISGNHTWDPEVAAENDANIEAYLAENNVLSAVRLFRAAALTGQAGRFVMSIHGTLLDALSKLEKPDVTVMEQLVEHAESHEVPGTISLYKHLFVAYSKVKDASALTQVWSKYRDLAKTASREDWAAACGQRDASDDRIEGAMREPWDIVISAFIEVGELSKAFEVFGEMAEVAEKKTKGEVPPATHRTCGVLVAALARAGELDLALEWFNSLQASAILIENSPHRLTLEHTIVLTEQLLLKGRWFDAADLVIGLGKIRDELSQSSAQHSLRTVAWKTNFALIHHAACSIPEEAARTLARAQEVLAAVPIQLDLRSIVLHLTLLAQAGDYTNMVRVVDLISARKFPANTIQKLNDACDQIAKENIPFKYRIELIKAFGRHHAELTPVVAEKLIQAYVSEKGRSVDERDLSKESLYTLFDAFTVVEQKQVSEGEYDEALEQLMKDLAAIDISEDMKNANSNQAVGYLVKNVIFRFGAERARSMLSAVVGEQEAANLVQPVSPIFTQSETVSRSDSEAASPSHSHASSATSAPALSFSQTLTSSIERFTYRNPTITPLEAYALLRDGLSVSQVPRLEVILSLMDHLARRNDEPKVRELYELAQVVLNSLVRPDVQAQNWYSTENAMLIACCHLGYLEEAGLHRARIVQAGFSPNADAYATMIASSKDTTDDALVARELWEEALGMGVKPHLFLYNTVISKLSKARKAESALDLFMRMKSERIRPSSVTYGAVINACCRVGDALSAETLFEEMTSQPNFRPRVPPYNTMMQFYLQTQPNRERFLYYYGALQRARVPPSAHTYKLLLDAYATLPPIDIPTMELVFSHLIADKSVRVQGTHWASLISAYGIHAGDVKKAEEVFNKIPAKGGDYEAVVWEAWLNVLSQQGTIEQLEEARTRMLESGVQPTAYVYNVLINGYARAGNIGRAREVFESMGDSITGVAAPNNHPVLLTSSGHAKPSTQATTTGVVYREPSTYEAMIRAEVTCGDQQRAAEVLQRMEERGYPMAVYMRGKAALEGEPPKF
ncbi:pentatricopeptide repeat protein [Cryptococcus neoformans 125.91]|nr:pentatricopeptide repeat protein [Cryptococcus neoformans var. grubii 125.91]